MIALPVVEQAPGTVPVMNGAPLPFEPNAAAQAYADRVWAGQSDTVTRAEKIERVKRALAGQNLPFEGVVLP